MSVPPVVYSATRGPNGRVRRASVVSAAEAILVRQADGDVVVCGPDKRANRTQAREIEAAVGPWKREEPHDSAGAFSLPHFQQVVKPPAGHTFYETDNRKSE